VFMSAVQWLCSNRSTEGKLIVLSILLLFHFCCVDNVNVRDAIVSEAFLRFFVETCGHFTEYICTQQDGLQVFEVNTVCVAFVPPQPYKLFTHNTHVSKPVSTKVLFLEQGKEENQGGTDYARFTGKMDSFNHAPQPLVV